jgi:hypothetical protein
VASELKANRLLPCIRELLFVSQVKFAKNWNSKSDNLKDDDDDDGFNVIKVSRPPSVPEQLLCS